MDGDRIALWFFSTGALLAADWLAAPPPWLRCVAANYPALAPLPGWGAVEARFSPVDALRSAPGGPPVVLTRAGLEHPAFAETVQAFLDGGVDRIDNMNWEAIMPPPSSAGRQQYLTAISKVDDQ